VALDRRDPLPSGERPGRCWLSALPLAYGTVEVVRRDFDGATELVIGRVEVSSGGGSTSMATSIGR
jgi:hypothetical protein